jgi:hypothetical protein
MKISLTNFRRISSSSTALDFTERMTFFTSQYETV